MNKLILLLFAFFLIINGNIAQNDKIIINKKPRTTTSTPTNTNPYPNNNKKTSPYPGQNNTNNNTQSQQRVNHQNNQKLGPIDLGYTVSELGQTAKHNHYRITGHIYSNLNEPIFNHNRRIVIFKIDNWDSGFLNDDLQSIDGYPTQYKLNPSGNLFVFGNSKVREFAFDFKVKKGLQPRVRSEILKDWAPLKDYEQYLLLEYSMLNGTWNMENNAEAKFNIQFSAQGDQLVMQDIFGTQVSWTKAEGNSYVRKIGNIPPPPPPTNQQQQQQPSTNSNSSSNYPAGGYLGNGTNNNNTQNQQQRTNNQSGSDYPSGGYLGNGNSNNQNNNNQQQGNSAQYQTGAYSSVIEIVDRTTIRYRNSEGIVCLLKKE